MDRRQFRKMAHGLALGSRRISKVEKDNASSNQGFIAVPGSSDVHVRIPEILPAIQRMVRDPDSTESSTHEAILAGKLGEMVTGCLFLLPWLRRSLTAKTRDQLLLLPCLMLVTQMCVAIYVHLQPQVPASVLPLGIKPPVIPGVVLLLALLTAFAVWKQRRAEKAGDLPAQ